MSKSMLHVAGIVMFLFLSTDLHAAETQSIYGPETLKSKILGTTTKSYVLPTLSSATPGSLVFQNGNGDNLSPQTCSGNPLAILICQVENALRKVTVLLTRPTDVEFYLNNVKVLAKPTWSPALGKFTVPLALKTQNQIKVIVTSLLNVSVQFEIFANTNSTPNLPPVARLSLSQVEGFAPFMVSANGFTSSDADGQITSYVWNFGDGISAAGSVVTHIYTLAGNYNLTLSVTDNKGATNSVSQQIKVVQNLPPIPQLAFIAGANGTAPLMTYFTGEGSSDPENQSLSYSWNFGDGSPAVTGGLTQTHIFENAGTYTVTLTVKDSAGASSQKSVNVIAKTVELPVSPETVAPSLIGKLNPTIEEQISFLYTGPNPIQTNVDLSQVIPQRLILVRGRVLDESGQPLSGVTVRSLNEAQFGQTLSRADGYYDLAVHSGGNFTIDYSRAGFLKLQRHAPSDDQQQYNVMEDVILKKLDPKVTNVALNSNAIQVAQGSTQTDSDGTRTATLLVPSNTSAKIVMPDGSTRLVNSLNLRVTEFTVGENGQKQMPATLPPRSGYTYAVEVSADEDIALGAEHIEFSKPIPYYVDNFLNIPVGIAVPLGTYDYQKGYWSAQKDGIVLKITGITNGIAQVDFGNGSATQVELDQFLFSTEELQKLATLYPVGKTLWRITLDRFSPCDLNFMGGSNQAVADANPVPENANPNGCPKLDNACVVRIAERLLSEKIKINGTDFNLNYSTERVSGRKTSHSISIPLTGPTVDPLIFYIIAEVSIAGRTEYSIQQPEPNKIFNFIWDGKDAYGRDVATTTQAKIKVRYYFPSIYELAPFNPNQAFSFDSIAPGTSLKNLPGRGLFYIQRVFNRDFKMNTFSHNFVINEVGLWSLDAHHSYDVDKQISYKGSGEVIASKKLDKVVTTTMGSGQGSSGDGGPAINAKFNFPSSIHTAVDGSIYVSDTENHRIRKVTADGIVNTIAGTDTLGFSGDNGPAINAKINNPTALTTDRQGNIYFSDRDNFRIRKITPDGIITTIIGTGIAGNTGDEGPANLATINLTGAILLSDDGSMYISDAGNHVIRRITPDGIIHRYAGNGVAGYSGDGGNASLATLNNPNFTATGSTGDFYIADTGNNVVRKISPNGIIQTVAGTGIAGFSGDEGIATEAKFSDIGSVKISEGELYIVDRGNDRIRYVDRSGIVHTIIGSGTVTYNGDGLSGLLTNISNPTTVYFNEDKSLTFVDSNHHRIRRYGYVLPGTFSINEISVPSEDASEIYIFNLVGRHLRTLFAKTGAVKYEFSYDSSQRLVSIQDAFNNRTQIIRANSGVATQIVGPYGQVTQLSNDGRGFLNSVTDNLGNKTEITYTNSGLMTSFKKPKENTDTYNYDELGNISIITGPVGDTSTFGLETVGIVRHVSPEGRIQKILLSFGFDDNSSAAKDAAGLQTTTRNLSGYTIVSKPDGSQLQSLTRLDSRLGGMSKFTTNNGA